MAASGGSAPLAAGGLHAALALVKGGRFCAFFRGLAALRPKRLGFKPLGCALGYLV